MTLLQAIILGIVQGLTEFIPISSTAHLVLISRLVGLYAGVDSALRAEQTTATIAVIQLGTLLAVLIYFARDIVNISRAFVVDHLALISGRNRALPVDRATTPHHLSGNGGQGPPLNGRGKLSHDAWLGWLVIIGSVPVAIVGLLFKHQIEGTFTKNLWIIATMMIVIAILLALAEAV